MMLVTVMIIHELVRIEWIRQLRWSLNSVAVA